MPAQTPENLMPVLALRGLVVFPGMLLHFDVGREKSVNAINIAMEQDQTIFLVAQKDLKVEDPSESDLYKVGCVAKIRQILRLADDSIRVLIEGKYRASFSGLQNLEKCLIADIQRLEEKLPPKSSVNSEAMIRRVQSLFERYAALTPKMPKDISLTVISADDPGFLSDYIASNIQMPLDDKQYVLEQLSPLKRLRVVAQILNKECNILNVDAKINEKAKEYLDEGQKEYYLREQLRAINYELYGDDSPEAEAEEYRLKIEASGATDEAKRAMREEVGKLIKMPAGSHEATVVRNYLDTLLALPWGVHTKILKNTDKAAKLLDREHYGLKKVKDRILELMAVYALNPDIDGQIICLAGPPGVGKTSIARSLAKCMGRKFSRVSLGGVHDEAEINGHRRTYIGAMPGRIIKAVKNAGSCNPLILLDEVDKMGADMKGDPASALLEVLDSEQNTAFVDHYIDVPFDLSGVLFVCTANNISNIPAPLLDRMDLIELPGYTRLEKYHIATEHLIKKQLKKHGLSASQVRIDKAAVFDIIDYYTKEAGVRKLERKIAEIMRKSAKMIVDGKRSVSVGKNNLPEFLGVRRYRSDELPENNEVGLVNGLAWTEVGGEIMQLEVSVMDGSGKLELTGSLGDVMKESAKAAVSFVRSNREVLGIKGEFYKNKDIHIHATEAAVPKDGPSAGVAIVTALVSVLTGRPIKRDVAMTGEVTIRGRVLAIGGLNEKTMAAYRAGVKTVIVPRQNEKDITEIDEEVKKGLNFCFADTVFDVLDIALTKDDVSEKSLAADAAHNKLEAYNIRI